jgi:hypothetical protein
MVMRITKAATTKITGYNNNKDKKTENKQEAAKVRRK